MKLVAHQPEYLPYLGFFAKVSTADLFLVSDHLQYAAKDFQNRNYIRRSDGGKVLLTVPVRLAEGWNQTIDEVAIAGTGRWAKKHWKTIYHAYHKAPYFGLYAEALEDIYTRPWSKLVALNVALLRLLLRWLSIDVPMDFTSRYDLKESKTDLLIEMCKKTGADTFISGRGARDYVILERFAEEGLAHYFFDFVHPEYDQKGQAFMANLSVLDLLFNQGPAARKVIDEAVRMTPLSTF